MLNGYECKTCDEFHEGLPFSYGSPAPAMWFDIAEDELESRVLLSSDQCVIDDIYFFVLGRIEIPIIDAGEKFAWLQTELPCYPETTLNLRTNLHTRPVGERPFIELEPTDHPLAGEQREGITLKRVQEIAEICLHG